MTVTCMDGGGYISGRVLHIWTMKGTCLDDGGYISGPVLHECYISEQCRVHVWRIVTYLVKASDAELWCFLWSAPEQTVGQTNRDASDLRRHRALYNVTVMCLYDSSCRIRWIHLQIFQQILSPIWYHLLKIYQTNINLYHRAISNCEDVHNELFKLNYLISKTFGNLGLKYKNRQMFETNSLIWGLKYLHMYRFVIQMFCDWVILPFLPFAQCIV